MPSVCNYPMTDQMALLQVKHLQIEFSSAGKENIPAVKDISFQLEAGEVLGIVGESGSGKTVTALSLLGLLPKTAHIQGQLNYLGQEENMLEFDAKTWRHFRAREAGIIFQDPLSSLNPLIPCGKQVEEVLRLAEGRVDHRKTVLDWFERVRLPEPERMSRAYPHELSGGQRQRVMIAMAMCRSPRLLIADEPTTALDVSVQKSILDLLREMQQAVGTAILFISHDLGVIRTLAQRVLVMQNGEIVEQGPVQSIFEQAEQAYTKGLLACRPPLDHKLERLPLIADFTQAEKGTPPDPNSLTIPVAEEKARAKSLQQLPPLLEVRELQTWFPIRKAFPWQSRKWVKAVDAVDFDLYPGETLGVVGESGSGKTTLGRSILRLIEPNAGKIVYQGINLTSLQTHELRRARRDLQIIFQDPLSSLNPLKTVRQSLLEPLQVYGTLNNSAQRAHRVLKLLRQVDLDETYLERLPHQLSGGQRQRIGIARALAVEPKLLICDESVSALDVSVQAQVLNLLKDLQAEKGLTYIFISHDLSVIRFMADRVLVMQNGRVVERGFTAELLSNPKTSYTQSLLQAVV